MKSLIIISIMGVALMADCTVDLKKQYDTQSGPEYMTKVAFECIKTIGVTAGCVKKEKNTYTLKDNMTCIINNGNEAVGVALHPNVEQYPEHVTILVEEKNGIQSFPHGFKLVPLRKN